MPNNHEIDLLETMVTKPDGSMINIYEQADGTYRLGRNDNSATIASPELIECYWNVNLEERKILAQSHKAISPLKFHGLLGGLLDKFRRES